MAGGDGRGRGKIHDESNRDDKDRRPGDHRWLLRRAGSRFSGGRGWRAKPETLERTGASLRSSPGHLSRTPGGNALRSAHDSSLSSSHFIRVGDGRNMGKVGAQVLDAVVHTAGTSGAFGAHGVIALTSAGASLTRTLSPTGISPRWGSPSVHRITRGSAARRPGLSNLAPVGLPGDSVARHGNKAIPNPVCRAQLARSWRNHFANQRRGRLSATQASRPPKAGRDAARAPARFQRPGHYTAGLTISGRKPLAYSLAPPRLYTLPRWRFGLVYD